MRLLLIAGMAVAMSGSPVLAKSKGTRFWNLTRYTVTSLHLSPAGKNAWGPDLCKGDDDGTVDHDERLRIDGIKTGVYDVKLSDRIGRTCVVPNISVKADAIFVVEEKQLTDCTK